MEKREELKLSKIKKDSVPRQDRPLFEKCGWFHGGVECWRNSGKCLHCGEMGHMVAQCPKAKKEVPQKMIRSAGRVYSLIRDEDPEGDLGI